MQVIGERNDGRSREISEKVLRKIESTIFFEAGCLFLINGAEVAITPSNVAAYESGAILTPLDSTVGVSKRPPNESGVHKGDTLLMVDIPTVGQSVKIKPVDMTVVKPDGYKSITVYQNEDHSCIEEPEPPSEQVSVAEYYGYGGRHNQC